MNKHNCSIEYPANKEGPERVQSFRWRCPTCHMRWKGSALVGEPSPFVGGSRTIMTASGRPTWRTRWYYWRNSDVLS